MRTLLSLVQENILPDSGADEKEVQLENHYSVDMTGRIGIVGVIVDETHFLFVSNSNTAQLGHGKDISAVWEPVCLHDEGLSSVSVTKEGPAIVFGSIYYIFLLWSRKQSRAVV